MMNLESETNPRLLQMVIQSLVLEIRHCRNVALRLGNQVEELQQRFQIPSSSSVYIPHSFCKCEFLDNVSVIKLLLSREDESCCIVLKGVNKLDSKCPHKQLLEYLGSFGLVQRLLFLLASSNSGDRRHTLKFSSIGFAVMTNPLDVNQIISLKDQRISGCPVMVERYKRDK